MPSSADQKLYLGGYSGLRVSGSAASNSASRVSSPVARSNKGRIICGDGDRGWLIELWLVSGDAAGHNCTDESAAGVAVSSVSSHTQRMVLRSRVLTILKAWRRSSDLSIAARDLTLK